MADRSAREAAFAMGATWVGCCAALMFSLPLDLAWWTVGALLCAVIVVSGFAGASRIRPMSSRRVAERARLAGLSMLAGIVLGVLLVAALVVLAREEPGLHARFAGREGEHWIRPWLLAFQASILEEVCFRLFALAVLAWLTMRLSGNRAWSVGIATGVSTLLFALAHLPAWWMAGEFSIALITVVLLLNSIGALLFAWLFWHFGLPYAIAAHYVADVVIQYGAPRLL